MRIGAILFGLVGLPVAGLLLTHDGIYGWTLFVMIPVSIGALGGAITLPKSVERAALNGAAAAAIATAGLILVRLEGLICVLMALPLTVPLGALGGVLAYAARKRQPGPAGTAMLLLLPMGTGIWDFTAKPTVFKVHSAIEIAAPPEKVWNNVVTFSELPAPQEWFFRVGLAYPQRARIEGTGPGAIRYCEFSTGPFVEPIQVWDEPHLLRFNVTANPAPMHEWSPYAQVLPKHLHGYLISKQGQFQLTALPGDRTLLEGTTWYQHGLWPGEYWRWWSDAIIHRIHMRVLTHIRDLSEKQ